MASKKYESRIKYAQNLKLKTIGAFRSTLQQLQPEKYYFQNNLIEPCHLGKICLNFGIPLPNEFVNHFSFFENLATSLILKNNILSETSHLERHPLA